MIADGVMKNPRNSGGFSLRERAIVALLGGGVRPTALMIGLYRRSRLQGAGGRAAQLSMLVSKPFEYGLRCARFVRAHGRALHAEHGVPPWRQFLALYAGWLRSAAHPDQFAAYWALAVRPPRDWGVWLSGVQANILLGDLAERRAPEIARSIGDKRWFPRWAADQGLPVLPLLAIFESGRPVAGSPAECAAALPDASLFAKPADLWSGQGASRWTRVGPGFWEAVTGERVDAVELVRRLAEQSRDHPIVLQRCLEPHPDMRALASGAISTIRCVTYESPAGDAKLLRAMVRIPMAGMIVDNMNAGGTIASIDPETGRLSRCISWTNGLLRRSAVLPGSGSPVEGVVMPLWPEARRIALDAQRAAGLPFAGWDLAVCKEGPILLEANIRWGGHLLTFPTQSPLSDTEFPAMYMHHWSRGRRGQ
jgi:hypothetical protein